MPFNANVPLAPDQLSQSQADILDNFQAIGGMLDLTVGATAIKFARDGAVPPTGATDVGLYAAVSTSVPGSTSLFFRNQNNGASVDLTSYTNAAGIGWCRLPCGVIVKWGISPTGANGLLTAPLSNGPGIPTIVTLLSAQITSYGLGNGDTGNVYYQAFDEVGHTVTAWHYKAGPGGHNAGFYYLLLGL